MERETYIKYKNTAFTVAAAGCASSVKAFDWLSKKFNELEIYLLTNSTKD